MITAALVQAVISGALGTSIPGSSAFLHLRAGTPSVSPPTTFAEANPIPSADVTGEAGGSFVGENYNGGTEYAGVNPTLATFQCVSGHAPQTAVGWVLMSALASGQVLAYGDFESPMMLLSDASAIVLAWKVVMGADKFDVEVSVID